MCKTRLTKHYYSKIEFYIAEMIGCFKETQYEKSRLNVYLNLLQFKMMKSIPTGNNVDSKWCQGIGIKFFKVHVLYYPNQNDRLNNLHKLNNHVLI